jgi:predicted metal-dependent hydrolase
MTLTPPGPPKTVPTTSAFSDPDVKVEVVRSRKRRKTVSARQVGNVLRVSVPATMSRAEEEHWVNEMARRLRRRMQSSDIDLVARAQKLASQLGLPKPREIRWSGTQNYRWGSCTPARGTVRISSRLAKEPLWVLDYVIVHELAHLDEPGHDRAFWDLVGRYPLAERARGFLIARGVEEPDGPTGEDELGEGDELASGHERAGP